MLVNEAGKYMQSSVILAQFEGIDLYIFRFIFSAVWSMLDFVYFYNTLRHTNWPNVLLWRIIYRLKIAERKIYKKCFFSAPSAVVQRSMLSQQVFVPFVFIYSPRFDSTLSVPVQTFLFFFAGRRIFIAIDKYKMRYDAQTWKLTFNIIKQKFSKNIFLHLWNLGSQCQPSFWRSMANITISLTRGSLILIRLGSI